MARKTKASQLQILGIVIGIGAIIVGLLSITAGATSGTDGFGDIIKQSDEVECSVTIGGDVLGVTLGDPDIQSVSCTKTGETCTKLFSASPLGLFSTTGKIIYDASDVRKTQSFDIDRFGAETLTTTLCTDSILINVKVLDEDGNIVDTQSASVN